LKTPAINLKKFFGNKGKDGSRKSRAYLLKIKKQYPKILPAPNRHTHFLKIDSVFKLIMLYSVTISFGGRAGR